MARIKFNELAKQTMTPESIARSRKAAIKEIPAMELAELRDILKVTQVDLAGRMKVSQAAISKLEKRNRNIHVDQLRSIVSAMGGNLKRVGVESTWNCLSKYLRGRPGMELEGFSIPRYRYC